MTTEGASVKGEVVLAGGVSQCLDANLAPKDLVANYGAADISRNSANHSQQGEGLCHAAAHREIQLSKNITDKYFFTGLFSLVRGFSQRNLMFAKSLY